MIRDPHRSLCEPVPGWRRRALPIGVVLLASVGLVGCGQDSEPLESGVTAEELQDVRDELSALQERVDALDTEATAEPTGEPSSPPGEGPPDAEPTPQFTDGEDVSVRAEVIGLIATTEIGTAFRVSTGSGRAVAVVSATPVEPLDVQDVVRVSGTAMTVDPETFERDFGIAAAVVFDDPDAFFAGESGQIAIAADQVEPAADTAAD